MFVCGNNSSGIAIDFSKKFRYKLWRVSDISKDSILWVLLNPSTADEKTLDPTLTRCWKYSTLWGYGEFRVINVFAYRATDPKKLFKLDDKYIVGVENNDSILKECCIASKIIVGWGNNICRFEDRLIELDQMLYPLELYALNVTKRGQPSHPLYLRGDKKPFLYKNKNQSLLEVIKNVK
jgi:hypothetical protein